MILESLEKSLIQIEYLVLMKWYPILIKPINLPGHSLST